MKTFEKHYSSLKKLRHDGLHQRDLLSRMEGGGVGVLGLAAEDQALGRRMTLDVCDSLSLEGSTRKCFLFQKLTIGSLRPPLASSTLMYHYEAACSPR